jgi:hypothetical protein
MNLIMHMGKLHIYGTFPGDFGCQQGSKMIKECSFAQFLVSQKNSYFAKVLYKNHKTVTFWCLPAQSNYIDKKRRHSAFYRYE